eukprot:SAG22_NODE_19907_length_270_cov_1.058480_1_plen_60_part_10
MFVARLIIEVVVAHFISFIHIEPSRLASSSRSTALLRRAELVSPSLYRFWSYQFLGERQF